MPNGKLNPITSGDQILMQILDEVKGIREDLKNLNISGENTGIQEMYKCPECGKPYKSYSGLKAHYNKEHK